jgi:hypothetical protein
MVFTIIVVKRGVSKKSKESKKRWSKENVRKLNTRPKTGV